MSPRVVLPARRRRRRRHRRQMSALEDGVAIRQRPPVFGHDIELGLGQLRQVGGTYRRAGGRGAGSWRSDREAAIQAGKSFRAECAASSKAVTTAGTLLAAALAGAARFRCARITPSAARTNFRSISNWTVGAPVPR